MLETIKEQILKISQNEYNFLLLVLLLWVYFLVLAEFIWILITHGSKKISVVRLIETIIWGALSVSIIYAYQEKWAVVLFIVITFMKLLSQLLNVLKLMEKWSKVELYLAELLELIFKILHKAFVEKIENFIIKKVNIAKLTEDNTNVQTKHEIDNESNIDTDIESEVDVAHTEEKVSEEE